MSNIVNVAWMYPDILNLHGERGNAKAFELVSKKMGVKLNIDRIDDIDSNISMYKSDLFNIDMIKIHGKTEGKSNEESFYAYIVIEGSGNIQAGNYMRNIEKGTTFLIPASLGDYTISGDMKLMKIWV